MSDQPNYWQRMRTRRLSRRAILGASARAGVGAAGLALVGCGDDDDDDSTAAQAQPQSQRQQQAQAQQQAEQAAQQEAPAEEQAQQQAPAQQAAVEFKTGGEYRTTTVGTSSGNPPTLDPYENLTYRTQIPSGHHYSRILRHIRGQPGVDPLNFGEYEGDAAQDLPEIPDPQTYIFTLRDNLKWQNVEPLNGRPVTLDDIAQSEARFREQSPNSLSWTNVVESLETGTDNTFTLHLSKTFAPLLNLASSPEHFWIIPPEIVEDGSVAQRPVGSGAWIFERLEPDVEMVWRRNPDWYEPGIPLMDGLREAIIADPSTIIANLAAGELDASLLASSVFNASKEQAPDLVYSFNLNQVIGGTYFNFSNEPWGDPRVRQAWSMAHDRDGLLAAQDETGQGRYFSAISHLAPYFLDPQSDEFGPNAKFFMRDVEQARQLLDAAGFPDGLDVVINATQGYGPATTSFFELIASTVAEAGFRSNFSFKEYAAYIGTTFIGDFPEGLGLGPLKVAVEPDDIFFTVYHPESGRRNWGEGPGSPSEDPDLLAMFDQQRSELDFDTRVELIKEIQRVMAESMYMVPYVGTAGVTGYQPYVRQLDYDSIHPKSSYAAAQDHVAYFWLDV